jgi:saccharopine dehydrogenase (NAD+, L-lysine-forming)
MTKLKIGVIKEGKVPQDTRVPLIPDHLKILKQDIDDLGVTVEPSDIRCYQDSEYTDHGIELSNELADCDVLLGVKEVPIDQLISNKTYLFFSHTIKEQPYNRNLLRAILEKNISLIDYEVLTNRQGARIVAFGRYAGLVGAYNGLLTYGKKFNLFNLRRAHECFDLEDLKTELPKISLPSIKILVTGGGRVAGGSMEILDGAKIRKVAPEEILNQQFDEPVYANLLPEHYNRHKYGKTYSDNDFFANPKDYEGNFTRFAEVADLLIASAYWDPEAPVLFTKEDISRGNLNLKVIADITCDIEGSIPTTLRATTIADPWYDYDKAALEETSAFSGDENITVMSIDNLPNELPRNASEDFSKELTNQVIPLFVYGDKDDILKRATITKDGRLTEHFSYLQNYVDGK